MNLRSDDGFTPIIVAAYDGSTEVVRALLAAGSQIQLRYNEWLPGYNNI